MSENDKKYTCVYCHCEFEAFDNNIVICEKCGNPYHKDCWEENGKCSIYGCDSTSAHSPVGFVKKIKEEPKPSPRTEEQAPIIINRTNPIIWIVIIILAIVFSTIIALFYNNTQKSKFKATINAPEEIRLLLNENDKKLKWDLDKYLDEIDEKNIVIENNNPDLFTIKGTKDLFITTFNKEGNGYFTISIKDNRFNIENHKIKVVVSDPNKPNIKFNPIIKEVKIGKETSTTIKIDKGIIVDPREIKFNYPNENDSGEIRPIINCKKENNIKEFTFTITGIEIGKVNIQIVIPVTCDKKYYLEESIPVNVVE